MPQSYCSLVYHIVYSTKDRVPWLKGDTVHRVHEYLGGAIRKERGAALIVNGTADHVHLLASLRQDKAVSDVVVRSNRTRRVGCGTISLIWHGCASRRDMQHSA